MRHAVRFKILGFLDTQWKWRGSEQTTFFKAEHQFETDHVPGKEQMIAYSAAHGYWPSNKEGSTLDRCSPVYETIGGDFGYQNCAICFPQRADVVDNMAAAG